jgi:cysteine desulfurase / selenocysteine lyase
VISPSELLAAITPRTKLFCTTWVHSFSGHSIDIDGLGEICRARNVLFVVNGSQAIGARAIDISRHPVDAVTAVGFKWLCGPYGTGFCWLSAGLLDKMHRTKAYWLSMLTAADLAGALGDLSVGPISSAADLDVFGTANFFNFTAFAKAVELLIEIGPREVQAHDQALIQSLVDACEETSFRLISPPDASDRRSTLVLIDHENPERINMLMSRLEAAGVYAAMRAGAVRLSPHLYNSSQQIEDVCAAVAEAS